MPSALVVKKGRKMSCLQPLGHAGAVVGDLDLGAAGAGAREASARRAALVGMAARRLGGVAEQVDQHLAHQVRIGLERCSRSVDRRG